MSSLNKIHVNNSTNISLNDRFTLIQTLATSEPNVLRSTDIAVKGSAKNTQLIRQLEKRRTIMAALKIKKRSLRRNVQHRIGNNRNNTKMMHDLINVRSVGKLRRSNSLAAIATMNADKIQKPIQRRNSVSIADRLGYRRGGGGSLTNRRGGPGLRRPLNRNNFNNLRRSNSKQNLNIKPRNRTRSNGNANLSANNGAQNRNRSRSRSRSNVRNVSGNRNNDNNRSRSRSRSNIRARSNSVNSRLGPNRTSAPVSIRERRGRPVKGRVFRRSVHNNGSNNNNNVQTRRGRSRTRSVPRGQIQQRPRSRSGSRPNSRAGRNNNSRGQRRGGIRRGSSSSRGRGNARGKF